MRTLEELERIVALVPLHDAKGTPVPATLKSQLSEAVAALGERVDALEQATELPPVACCARPVYRFTIERDPATGLISAIVGRPIEELTQ